MKNEDYYLQTAASHAKKMIQENGHLMSHFIFFTKNDATIFVPYIVHNDEEKVQFYEIIKVFTLVYGVDRYIFVNEAWASKNVDSRPSKDPDRIDAVVILSVSRKSSKAEMYEKITTENGVTLKRLDDFSGGIAGPATELLPSEELVNAYERSSDEEKDQIKNHLLDTLNASPNMVKN